MWWLWTWPDFSRGEICWILISIGRWSNFSIGKWSNFSIGRWSNRSSQSWTADAGIAFLWQQLWHSWGIHTVPCNNKWGNGWHNCWQSKQWLETPIVTMSRANVRRCWHHDQRGTAAIIKEHSPKAVYRHFANHRLNLAMVKAMYVQEARNMTDTAILQADLSDITSIPPNDNTIWRSGSTRSIQMIQLGISWKNYVEPDGWLATMLLMYSWSYTKR